MFIGSLIGAVFLTSSLIVAASILPIYPGCLYFFKNRVVFANFLLVIINETGELTLHLTILLGDHI